MGEPSIRENESVEQSFFPLLRTVSYGAAVFAFDPRRSLTSTPKLKTNASVGQSAPTSDVLATPAHSADSGYISHSRSASKIFPLSPNAAAFSIANLLGSEKSQKNTKVIASSVQQGSTEFQCLPLDFSSSGGRTNGTACSSPPRLTKPFHCRFCNKAYNARSSCRYVSIAEYCSTAWMLVPEVSVRSPRYLVRVLSPSARRLRTPTRT
nr:unnamed protein product [Spirometra erinaceieuropaei]